MKNRTGRSVIRKVRGRRARFCNGGCAEGFREDRKAGLIYAPHEIDGAHMGVEEASVKAFFCAYCNASLKKYGKAEATKLARGYRSALRMIVGNLHVGTSMRGVIRHFIRDRNYLSNCPDANLRKAIYREALRLHSENQQLVKDFRL